MSRWWIRAALALLLLALVVAGALTAAWLTLPLDGTTITVDGARFPAATLRDEHAVAAFVIALVVTLVAGVVAATALAFGIAVAALAIGLGVFATVATLAVLASPLLLLVWLVWRATRPARGGATAAA